MKIFQIVFCENSVDFPHCQPRWFRHASTYYQYFFIVITTKNQSLDTGKTELGQGPLMKPSKNLYE